MLGRAVQLSCFHRTPGEEAVTDSMPAAYYLQLSLHPSSTSGEGGDGGQNGDGDDEGDVPLSAIRERNRQGGSYLWGDYLGMHIRPPPQLRLLNLETSVTESIANPDVPWHKGIRYHLNPRNLRDVLAGFERERHGGTAPIPYALCFANNHAMDFGRRAMEQETVPALAGLLAPPGLGRVAGAGADSAAAGRPAEFHIPVDGAGTGDVDGDAATTTTTTTVVQVFAMATQCSGTPLDWAAGAGRAGMVVLPPLRSHSAVDEAVRRVTEVVQRWRRPPATASAGAAATIVVLSVHWGPNWAYRGRSPPGAADPDEADDDGQKYRRDLAHRLLDAGTVHLIYGHSSHHVRGLARRAGKLVIYGAGDLVTDYEGFRNPGDERYSRLGALILADVDAESGDLQALRLVPTFVDRLRLRRLREGSRVWDPASESMRAVPGAAHRFASFVDALSVKDAGPGGEAIRLRVWDDDGVPGGPVLVYP